MTNALKAHTRRFVLAGLSAAALAALAADPDAKASASITGTAHEGGSMPGRRSSIVIDCETDRDVVTILRNGEIFGLREGEAVALIDQDVFLVPEFDMPIRTTHFLYGGDYQLIGSLPV